MMEELRLRDELSERVSKRTEPLTGPVPMCLPLQTAPQRLPKFFERLDRAFHRAIKPRLNWSRELGDRSIWGCWTEIRRDAYCNDQRCEKNVIATM